MSHEPRPPTDDPGSSRPDEPVPGSAEASGEGPDFGPSGYLPPKASARARKIVLRAPLGLQWVVGALIAGLVVVVAGVLWLGRSGPPGAPYVATVAIDTVEGAVALDDLDVLLVTGGGPAVAFAGLGEHDLAFCVDSRRIEGSAEGGAATWHPATGRGYGVESLDRHPVLVHGGTAYVDPTTTMAGPRPAPNPEPPGCS